MGPKWLVFEMAAAVFNGGDYPVPLKLPALHLPDNGVL
jgi:hypothetical protein